ncbi:MAG: methylated-DNA--[protein]-cysteine S-methyltransferase [Phycisphaerae bacterium]|nr:methylated-DNA--[protein]-cysteine S-methyltransferase [Phycisphaerae bacterium]
MLARRDIPSPIGTLVALADDALRALQFPRATPHTPPADRSDPDAKRLLDLVQRQLDDYFAGTRRTFDLPLAPRGTPFQRAVWDALREIPFGTTLSYGALARRLGRPDAARAVGAANGANPIAIIIPCHRVSNAAGDLHGYGGGLGRKRWLLDHEQAIPALVAPALPAT